jgi:hypothetical protein
MAAAGVRLKDSQRLGELKQRNELTVEVRSAPGSAWPHGGLDLYLFHGGDTGAGGGGGGGGGRGGGGRGGGGGAPSLRGAHTRGGSLGGGDDDVWMENLAGIVTVKLRVAQLPEVGYGYMDHTGCHQLVSCHHTPYEG